MLVILTRVSFARWPWRLRYPVLFLYLRMVILGPLASSTTLGDDLDTRERRSVVSDGLAVDEEQGLQLQRLPAGHGDPVDGQHVADRDLLLPAAGADDGVHHNEPVSLVNNWIATGLPTQSEARARRRTKG